MNNEMINYLLDLVPVLDIPQDFIDSLYEVCDDDCQEFCCIRSSVLTEYYYHYMVSELENI